MMSINKKKLIRKNPLLTVNAKKKPKIKEVSSGKWGEIAILYQKEEEKSKITSIDRKKLIRKKFLLR